MPDSAAKSYYFTHNTADHEKIIQKIPLSDSKTIKNICISLYFVV